MSSSIPMTGTTTVPTPVPSNNQIVLPQITFPNPPISYNPVPNPYNTNTQVEIPGPELYRVTGMDGAKKFVTVANARYALFDDDDDVMYIKTTDKNNYPSIVRYRFFQEDEPIPAPPPEPATKEDYQELQKQVEKLSEEIRQMKETNGNGKQFVRSKSNNYRNNGSTGYLPDATSSEPTAIE